MVRAALRFESTGLACYVIVDDREVSTYRASDVEDRIEAWLEAATHGVGDPAYRPF